MSQIISGLLQPVIHFSGQMMNAFLTLSPEKQALSALFGGCIAISGYKLLTNKGIQFIQNPQTLTLDLIELQPPFQVKIAQIPRVETEEISPLAKKLEYLDSRLFGNREPSQELTLPRLHDVIKNRDFDL